MKPGMCDAEHVGAAAHGPQHAEEHDRGQHGVHDAGAEIDHRLGRDPGVLGDAELGRVQVGGGDAQAVEALVVEPALGEALGQPLPPEHLQPHAGDQLEHR